jgi:hypothetical protein
VRVAIKVSFELPKGMAQQRASRFVEDAVRNHLGMYADNPTPLDWCSVRAELIRKPPKGKR